MVSREATPELLPPYQELQVAITFVFYAQLPRLPSSFVGLPITHLPVSVLLLAFFFEPPVILPISSFAQGHVALFPLLPSSIGRLTWLVLLVPVSLPMLLALVALLLPWLSILRPL